MNRIVQISAQFAVTGALAPGDLGTAARGGFRSVLSNLPDGELPSSPVSTLERELARRAGLGFCHVPIPKGEICWARLAGQMLDALRGLPAPVLAHCASGQRSALAWAAAAAACHPVDGVLGVLSAAGFNYFPLREELAGLAGLGGSGSIPAALALEPRRPG
jgi:uncharacterized protein (TIGR01244 family)